VDVAAGATLVLEAVLERAPIIAPTETVSPVVWVGGGVALGALVGAIALGTLSVATAGEALDMRQAYAFYADREIEASVANVLFGVAGAGAIAAIVGLFFPERSVPDEQALRVEPTLGGLVIRGALR
jgi:hypothetical protein